MAAKKGMSKLPKGWGMAEKHGAIYRIVRNKWIYIAADRDEAIAIVAVQRKNEKQLKKAKREDDRRLAVLLDLYLEDCRQRKPPLAKALAPKTIENYTDLVNVLKSYLGNNDVENIDDELIENWRDGSAADGNANNGYAKQAPFMFNNALRFLKAALDFARVKLKWFPKDSVNPLRDVAKLDLENRDYYIEDEEYVAIWERAKDWVRIAMDLSLLTGMREGDIAKLHLADLRDDGIYVAQGKSKGKRKQLFEIGEPETNEYNPALLALMDEARALNRPVRSMFVICSERNPSMPVTGKKIYEGFKLAARKAGYPDTHFHDVRAKFATDADSEGIDITKSLGHASRAMSERYVKLRKIERVQARNVVLLRKVGS